MESASALLKLVRDASTGAHSSRLSESNLIQQLESVRKQLLCSTCAAIPREAIAIVVCHVTSQVVAFLVQYRPVNAQTAAFKWQKRVFLLETAVASALASIGSFGDVQDALTADKRSDFCYVYKAFMQRLWETTEAPQLAVNAVQVLTQLCQVLTCCWLLYDRVWTLRKVTELLTVCSDFCLNHVETKQFAKWPLLLLGMVEIFENGDYTRALECFQGAVGCGDGEDGVIYYWYAVALVRSGQSDDAITALNKCIQANYEPVACLSLQALVNMQAQDFHAASEKLQRAVEIDVSQSRSLFNYALLMECMDNFEGQQQLLEYVLESLVNDQTTKKRNEPEDKTDSSNTVETSTCLFDKANSSLLCPFQVHLHLARAAMENGHWLESKKHFEKFFTLEDQVITSAVMTEIVQDYVYVLLQCKFPSLALSKCDQFLQKLESSIGNEMSVMVSMLRLHLFKADALLCLEQVDKCYALLKQTIQPMVQEMMRMVNSSTDGIATSAISQEMMMCHTQLLNNLAVATACCDGIDAAVSVLRDGLALYPNCLAIHFNLVLLLWRKGAEATACSLWFKARGWKSQESSVLANSLSSLANKSQVAGRVSGMIVNEEVWIKEEPQLVEKAVHEDSNVSSHTEPLTFTAAVSSSFQHSTISEHVQDNFDGEGGVSTQQLSYLDALVLNYWRKNRNIKLVEKSHEYVQYIESLGSNIPRNFAD